jgi:hypothetical protein
MVWSEDWVQWWFLCKSKIVVPVKSPPAEEQPIFCVPKIAHADVVRPDEEL